MVLALFLAVLGAAMGIFRDAQIPPRGEPVPASAESALVAAELAARPGSDIAPVLLVATRPDGAALSATDEKALAGLTARVAPTDLPPVGPPTATVSADGRAAYTLIPVRTGAENSDNIATITDLRAEVDKATPAGLDVVVTGGPAFGADIANAFSGADFRLLAVTVGVVAVLLLITYRSPILWLIPLTVVGVADQLAGVVTKAVGDASGLTFDAGIVSVLVFGAGTNYALLLISRYREELAREADHRGGLPQPRIQPAPHRACGCRLRPPGRACPRGSADLLALHSRPRYAARSRRLVGASRASGHRATGPRHRRFHRRPGAPRHGAGGHANRPQSGPAVPRRLGLPARADRHRAAFPRRAMICAPIAAWMATSNICRGMSFLILAATSRPPMPASAGHPQSFSTPAPPPTATCASSPR